MQESVTQCCLWDREKRPRHREGRPRHLEEFRKMDTRVLETIIVFRENGWLENGVNV